MPARKIFTFNDHPMVSIIIPSLDGNRCGNVEKLVKQIKKQTVKNIEIILSINEKPNGHARNIGVLAASKNSKYLCFFDDDVELGTDYIIKNFIDGLEIEKVGLVGASQLPPSDSSLFQRWIAYDLDKASSSIKKEIVDSEMVTHAGLACKTVLWRAFDGEDSNLITGTDTDLRERMRNNGYRVILVPNTFVFHPLPKRLFAIFIIY